MSKKIGWGIVGLGNIAAKFAADLKLIPGAELCAVASRNKEKAKTFARAHNASQYFDSYQALYNHKEVDVVYIALPHSYHAAESIKAMNAGKHVCCEKPMGMNKSEVELMVQVAAENSCFLMEAMWSRFNPAIVEVINKVTLGELGKIRHLHADFGFNALHQYPGGRLFDPKLGGGSLLDIGIYPVFLAYTILGIPKQIQASAMYQDNGVEYQTAIQFSYGEAHAHLFSSLACDTLMRAEITGENGQLFLEPRWHEAESYTHKTKTNLEHIHKPLEGKGYVYEILEVHRCLQQGLLQSELWSHQHSIDLISLLDTIARLSRENGPGN